MEKEQDSQRNPGAAESLTNDIPAGLRAHARSRTSLVEQRIAVAIEAIKQDLQVNDGVYPHNRGRLSVAEVCRRAKVPSVTIQGPLHKSTTRLTISRFVDSVQGSTKASRRTQTGPVDSLPSARDRLAAIATAYHLDMLKVISLEERIRELEADNAELLAKLGSNVISLDSKR